MAHILLLTPYNPMLKIFALFLCLQSCHPSRVVNHTRRGFRVSNDDSKVVVKNSGNVHIYVFQDSIHIDTITE